MSFGLTCQSPCCHEAKVRLGRQVLIILVGRNQGGKGTQGGRRFVPRGWLPDCGESITKTRRGARDIACLPAPESVHNPLANPAEQASCRGTDRTVKGEESADGENPDCAQMLWCWKGRRKIVIPKIRNRLLGNWRTPSPSRLDPRHASDGRSVWLGEKLWRVAHGTYRVRAEQRRPRHIPFPAASLARGLQPRQPRAPAT